MTSAKYLCGLLTVTIITTFVVSRPDTVPNQFHKEHRKPDGTIVRVFGFQDPNGSYKVIERRVYQTDNIHIKPTDNIHTNNKSTKRAPITTKAPSTAENVNKLTDSNISLGEPTTAYPFLFGGNRRLGEPGLFDGPSWISNGYQRRLK